MKLEATQILRGLISEVRMVPDRAAPGLHQIELIGELAGILALSDADTTKPPRMQGLKSVSLVAGAGFEPAAFRL